MRFVVIEPLLQAGRSERTRFMGTPPQRATDGHPISTGTSCLESHFWTQVNNLVEGARNNEMRSVRMAGRALVIELFDCNRVLLAGAVRHQAHGTAPPPLLMRTVAHDAEKEPREELEDETAVRLPSHWCCAPKL